MFTYVEEDKVLFTCDVFGSHYCSENGMFDDNAGDFSEELRYYFDVIMGPFKKYVLQAMDKIENLNIDMICTSHGPIHRENPRKYIDIYREWSKDVLRARDGRTVSIFYVSAYGNTKFIAGMMKDTIKNAGIKVNIFDISEENIDELVKYVECSDGILVGSPTINQDAVKPVWDLLSLVSPIINRGKAAGAFGSYGWSGEGVGMITDRLKSLKFKVIEPGLKVNFVPSDAERVQAVEFAGKIIDMIKKKE
jgi:flavorubredoxin